MLTTILLGFAVSIFTEVATFINKYLNGTTFQGKGAYILAVSVAVIAALVNTFVQGHIDVQSLIAQFAGIYASSEIFFNVILNSTGLTVKPGLTPAEADISEAIQSATSSDVN